MSSFRKLALEIIGRRSNTFQAPKKENPSAIFSTHVFTMSRMKEFLPLHVVEMIENSVSQGKQIDRDIADMVASGMKNWAVSHGATHFTHWFQPLTGGTAEKHDTFLQLNEAGQPIEIMAGENLVQQEPDASSFPSGGIRNTFEARGYSAWDPSSPAFIIDNTLCIPTIFISYTGEALDFKVPLIKSLSAIDKAATDICQYIDKNINRVYVTLGWEQEYFLIDEALYNARPDLALTGRTLFGHEAAKGQQLEDHYFGSIPDRIRSFMDDYEHDAWRLGIPVRTRHNEVAPNQYELAAQYEEANLANDHNQLMMFLMQRSAKKHHFKVLFHEKPFAGVNGSGKHNNWSLATDTGRNLLSPGKNPKSNLLFLTIFINTIKAFHDHADLLRGSIASASNDHRLGANEAPPAIMSVFAGSYLTNMLEDFCKKVSSNKFTPEQKTALKLNIIKIPPILIDNTDRNRTSPFAFTGNKFEFRSVGSSENCAAAMIALNTAVAGQLVQFKKDVDKLLNKGFEKDEAMYIVLKETYKASKQRIFDGNGYSCDWISEAKKRGLSNINNAPEALKTYINANTIKLFKNNNILTERELEARYEIKLEKYYKIIQIESRVLGDIALNHIIPVALNYQHLLIENVRGLKEIYPDKEFRKLAKMQMQIIEEIAERISSIKDNVTAMTEARKKANSLDSAEEKASAYCKLVFPYFALIRYEADKIELLVDDETWTLPKYREIMNVY
ncbi:MAG: glutamine synthetase type III [Bacteroidetes bacterium HGW-Bacteroidetes-21]|nr:MAG: glutamine synthetase type III [Bacteroidetes bacterium HGW-Bacteroidetes-21]